MKEAIIFLSGELKGSQKYYLGFCRDKDIYCADGGANHTYELGIVPEIIYGDMDSIRVDVKSYYKEQEVFTVTLPPEKDFTDGEYIIKNIHQKEYDKIYIIGGLGGELAHTLGNLNLLLNYPKLVFVTEKEDTFLVPKSYKLNNASYYWGCSFLPVGDVVKGLILKGVKYPLDNFDLFKGDTRCLSNEIKGTLEVSYEEGELLGIFKKR